VKEWKERKTKYEKEKYGENKEVEKYRKECICDFWNISKISEKERKLTATNY